MRAANGTANQIVDEILQPEPHACCVSRSLLPAPNPWTASTAGHPTPFDGSRENHGVSFKNSMELSKSF